MNNIKKYNTSGASGAVLRGNLALIKIAYRNIWRNLRRTLFCVTAVGIAVLFIALYSSMIEGMIKSINDTVQVYELGHITIVSKQYEDQSEYMPVQFPVAGGRSWKSLAADIKAIPGVREVFPRIATMATLQDSAVKHAVLWGLDIRNEMAANNFNLTYRNDGLLEGRWPEKGANEIAIGRVFAQKSGLTVGDRLLFKTISAQYSEKFLRPVITGIFNFDYIKIDEQYLVMDIERLQNLLVLEDATQSLVIFADDENYSGVIASQARIMLGDDNVVNNWTDNYWVAVLQAASSVYMVVFLVFIIVASFLIINTVVMIIHERIKEIGMMGCLGMTRAEIVRVFFFESIFLSAIGAFAGALVGGIITGILSYNPIHLMEQFGSTFSEMPMSNAIFIKFSPSVLFRAWLMGVVVASVFTLIPSLKSAFIEPVEALRR